MQHNTPDRLLALLQHLLEIEATEVPKTLNRAALLIAQALSAEKVDVFLHDAQTHTLVALGVSDTPLGHLEKSLGMDRLPIVNGGRAVSVFQTGSTYREGRVDQDPEELPGIRLGMGVCSSITVPLVIGQERRGVIQVDSTQSDFFTDQDQSFLEGVAHWIGIVAHRAELIQQVAQEAAAEARRMTAEELMTVLAHDLRNYLTPLRARLQLIQQRATRDQRKQDLRDVAGITSSLRRFEHLISDLMDMTRLSQGLFALTWQPIDLALLAQEIAKTLQTPTVQIMVQIPEDLLVWADADRLRQALENVIANAVKHAPSGTAVHIEAHKEDGEERIVLSVSDQGPGIAREVLPYLFEPFRKGNNSTGLGLGLYLAHQIVLAHGGTLTVDTTVTQGTRFVFSLPTNCMEDNEPSEDLV